LVGGYARTDVATGVFADRVSRSTSLLGLRYELAISPQRKVAPFIGIPVMLARSRVSDVGFLIDDSGRPLPEDSPGTKGNGWQAGLEGGVRLGVGGGFRLQGVVGGYRSDLDFGYPEGYQVGAQAWGWSLRLGLVR
jgi:hypothetical protein